MLVLLGLLVTLLVAAFGSGSTGVLAVSPNSTLLLPAGPPKRELLATHGRLQELRLYLPVSERRLTAIGYHGAAEGALPLDPRGRQANEGVFTRLARRLFGGGGKGLPYYLLGGAGPATAAVDVGAPAETDVYAPVDGTIVGIGDYVRNGEVHGSRIEIQPSTSPAIVVSITRLRPDPSLEVGSTVQATKSKIGRVLDLSALERQALARYTRDAGNHVTIEVHPAATLTTP